MDEEKVYYTIILRHDTSTNWMMNNPILALSEYGVEDDTHRVKRGDGQSNWADLPYEHFGLEYLVTYENLIGEVSDSEVLKNALNEKVDKSIFTENANGLIENIIINDEAGMLAKITRVTKDVTTGATRVAYLRIKSNDNSIQGVYSIDDEGIRVLNLQAYTHISDYEPGKTYYVNEICYLDNKLYRCLEEEFIAEPSFTKSHWVLLASLHSNDIRYNHLSSGLEAENVKEAIDELADLDSQKVKKTSRENKVYGTNELGEQYLYNKDDLRKVDTVNHKQADLNKNVQVDASDINYTDTDPSKGTVRQVLDSKVDKTVAGAGAKIVRDVQFDYDVTTGHIILREDKFSLEDGASATEQREIDVVSEQELAGEVQTLNNRIDDEVSTLNTRIDTEVDTINERVDTEVQTLNNRIDNEVETLNTTITTKETAIYNKIQDEHDEINERVDQEVSDLNDRIDDEVNTLNTTINNKEAALQAQITHNVEEINRVETESQERDTTLNNRIDTEVSDLNDRIDTEVDTINDRIDTEVVTLNNTINTKETAMDNKKINKSIAPGLVSEIIAATESNEPTLKITTKNTTTETPTVSHLHFKGQGQILTRFQDADHIVIDSTNIDNKNNQQDTRLTNAETRISANEDNITTLQIHDAAHDATLALHAQQIADNTHDIQDLQSDMTDANYDIGRLQTQNATQETHLTNLDELVQANADDIVTANQNISRNLASITDLQANKANKTFANLTNNKVVGTIATEALQNNEIIKLGVTSVDPSTETTSNGILKVISSDNTIIATRDRDTGVIDLKANLDTDVNYFITTETLNTTIPSQNIIPLNTLTPTDKINVEVHDIISDPEGTWARVESINTVTETCVAVTFKKHAQAVWGTVKGDILDQQDLQAQFSDIQSGLDDDIAAEETARIAADADLQDNIDTVAGNLTQEITDRGDADTVLQNNIDAEELARQNADTALDTAKVDKTSSANKVYGTDANGDQTIYDKNSFGKVDTVNNIQPNNNKNVQLDASNINMDDEAETKQTIKDAIVNIKQPLVIDATDIIFLSENSTSEEIFNAFGGKEVIEDIVKNAYIGNTILGRTYAEWGPPSAFGLDLINIDVSLSYDPYGKFDLDTYPSISIYMSFELDGTRYRIELYFYRNDSNIVVTYFGEYISEKVVYLSTSIAGLDKDESTQSEINDALRVSTGDIKTTNYYNKFITFKFGYYSDGTWYSSYTTGEANNPVLLDARIIRDRLDNLYNYKIIVKFIDNNNNILKKLVFTRSNEESDFVISSQEELDLSQITTNKTAIETLDNKIDGVEDRLQEEIDGKVETVNNVSLDTDTNNVTLDASDINIDKTAETKVTVKSAIENIKQPIVLDSSILRLTEESSSDDIIEAFGGLENIRKVAKAVINKDTEIIVNDTGRTIAGDFVISAHDYNYNVIQTGMYANAGADLKTPSDVRITLKITKIIPEDGYIEYASGKAEGSISFGLYDIVFYLVDNEVVIETKTFTRMPTVCYISRRIHNLTTSSSSDDIKEIIDLGVITRLYELDAELYFIIDDPTQREAPNYTRDFKFISLDIYYDTITHDYPDKYYRLSYSYYNSSILTVRTLIIELDYHMNPDGVASIVKIDEIPVGTINKIQSTVDDLEDAVAEAGKVDTVNNIQADANKNVQLDASNINIDDEAETKQTVKDAIVNIKQPFIISADFLALTEESTSQEIFNIFGGEDVIEKLIKNVYEGNIILTRMYNSYGFDGFVQEFKPITIELDHTPGSTFDLDTYTQISFTIYADTYDFLYILYFKYDRENHNIHLHEMSKYPKIYCVPINEEIARITPESARYKIESAIRLENPYNNYTFANQLNYEIRTGAEGAGFPSKIIYFLPNRTALEEDDNKHLLGEVCLITYWNDNIQNYDNDPKIKKFSTKYDETNSKYIIENYEEINLSQMETNRIAIETLQTTINNLISDLQSQIKTYTQNTAYTASGNYVTQKYVTFENNQGVVLMAKVLQNFTSDNTEATVYESLMKDVQDGNLKLVGIPAPSYEEVFNVLNQVDGQSDTYDGLGGTEEEVEEILDNILGN